ncbi:MAG: VPLPA-CTERM sorting domain-containing protein [Cellvibrionaceae bacterium]
MKLAKTLLATTVIATSFGASADWISAGGTNGLLGTGTDGELILTVWNVASEKSFTQDLGVGTKDFLLGNANAAQTFTLDAQGLSYIGAAGNSADIRYNVAGFNSLFDLPTYGLADVGYYFTGSQAPTYADYVFNIFSGHSTAFDRYETHLLNNNSGVGGTTDDPVYFLEGGLNYAGSSTKWGADYEGLGNLFNLGTVAGNNLEEVGGWALVRDINANNGQDAGPILDATINGVDAFWKLDVANGTVTYGTAGPAAVPLPAAAWLFGSALLGLAGAARRRKLAA